MQTSFLKHTLYLGILIGLVYASYFLCISITHAAAQYTPLVGIPGITDSQNATLPDYLNRIYLFIVTVGSLFGVLKIAMAGVKYTMTDVVTTMGDAKKDIFGVLKGLAILLIPFLLLTTINPDLASFDVLSKAQKMNLPSSERSAQTGGNTQNATQSNTNPATFGSGSTLPSPSATQQNTERFSCTAQYFTDEWGNPDTSRPIDFNACRNGCSSVGGSFTETDEVSGICEYLSGAEAVAPGGA